MDIFVTKYAIFILILIPLILVGVGIFLWKLIVNKSIANLKYKDFQVDFTNFKDIKEHGEGNDAENCFCNIENIAHVVKRKSLNTTTD